MEEVKTGIIWRCVLFVLILVSFPIAWVVSILSDTWRTLNDCVKVIEGKPFLTIAEETFKKRIKEGEKGLAKIEEIRRFF